MRKNVRVRRGGFVAFPASADVLGVAATATAWPVVGQSFVASPASTGIAGVVATATAGTAGTSILIPGAEYTLANATAGLPFAVNTPAPPNGVLTEVAVPGDMPLATALGTNGRRITIAPGGSYGGLTISGQDQEIIIGAGCTFGTVTFSGSARRIILRAAVARDCSMVRVTMPETAPAPEDIFVDGVYCTSTGTTIGGNRNLVNGTRIAYLNSFIRCEDFPLCAFNVNSSDVIVGNCNLESYSPTQAGVRFHNVNRFVFVDNRVRKENANHQVFRAHGGSLPDQAYTYVCRNLIHGQTRSVIHPEGAGAAVPDQFIDVWFEYNNMHITTQLDPGFLQVATSPGNIDNLRCRHNNFYGPSPFVVTNNYSEAAWDVSNNTIQPYQEPPAWEFQ